MLRSRRPEGCFAICAAIPLRQSYCYPGTGHGDREPKKLEAHNALTMNREDANSRSSMLNTSL